MILEVSLVFIILTLLYFMVEENKTSTSLILLSALLNFICIIISWNSVKYFRIFSIILFIILLLLIIVFTTENLLIFFVSYEAILVPVFALIVIWGYRVERFKAAYYFFFYTLLGSIFMLSAIVYIYNQIGTYNLNYLLSITFSNSAQLWLFLGFFTSLAVKIPKIPFHLWLPYAHVEAPVAGSVLLAGILLKLGGYGFIKFSCPLFPIASDYFSPFIITLSLIAIVYGGLITIIQADIKRLIAYSSIAHMGLVTIAIFTWDFNASIGMMLAHGLVSPMLFILVTLLYDRFKTRLVRYYRGLLQTMPLFAIFFTLASLANMAVPLSCSFIGEYLCINAGFNYSFLVGFFSTFGLVISATYSLYLLNRVIYSTNNNFLYLSRDLSRRENFFLIILISLVYILGLFPNLFIYAIY